MEDLPIDSLWVGGHVASTDPAPEVTVSLARLEARQQLQAFVDAGAQHLIISPIGHPRPSEMQRELAEDVLPTLTAPIVSSSER